MIEGDPHRHALHDLGEVTGRILWRDDAEDRACARRDAYDVPVEFMTGQDIRRDGCILAGTNAGELVLLEVRVDPQSLIGDDAHQIGTDGDVRARPNGTIADIAVDRSADLGVA